MSILATRNHNAGDNHVKYKKYFGDAISISAMAQKGLKPESVFDFINLSCLPQGKIEYLLNKTVKTFNSYKANNTHLDATTSEKILKLFALYDKGLLVFGSAEEFNSWLQLPAVGLGEQIPDALLSTITGIELVTQELIRIEYGDLA